MDLTKIILAIIALFAAGFTIKLVFFKKSSKHTIVQKNNIVSGGDIVGGNKTVNNKK